MRSNWTRWSLILVLVSPLVGCDSNPNGPNAAGVVKAGEAQAKADAAAGKTTKKPQYSRQVSAAD